ncbi:BatA domain-containing protein [Hymenobacter monticola]|uniref:BatA domain-containing protein n=1 Tax=Hymenobacter monticola TaxID=1705399 RepID=A0ABY4B336_9BACT|nr:BatA domain-containing protein [Hymenobacter monticola]UOE33558.1 BatA domain-containing protein [Hymenobacter monticola]
MLNPAALLALTGLLVPVAIHLWNRRPGREVAVGSLRWLAAGANRRLRHLKLEQLWLLLLRAALLGLLAVAVAGPVWRQPQPAGRGQVLLSPEVLTSPALLALRPRIDSLRRRGYGLRWLTAGFPKISGAVWRDGGAGLPDSARLLSAGAPAAGFGWAWVQQAAEAFAGQPLYVLTPAALHSLQGPHPVLRPGIAWQALPGAATTTWLQEANEHGDSLRLLIGKSTEAQTVFFRQATPKPQRPDQELQVAGVAPLRWQPGRSGRPTLASTSPDAQPGSPTRVAPPLTVAIHAAPAFALDARYLRAGIRAAAVGLASAPVVAFTTTPPAPNAQWLFWLSDEPLPRAWREAVRRGAQLWQEAAGPGVADDARLVPATPAEAPATLFRRSSGAAPAGDEAVWVDGQGRAVLSRRRLGAGAIYQLHTRLHPAWSNLADNPALPARLLALLHPAPADALVSTIDSQALATYDQRAIDPWQLLARSPGAAAANVNLTKTAPTNFLVTDLRPWLVLAAGLLFALERLLARRRENRTSNSSL